VPIAKAEAPRLSRLGAAIWDFHFGILGLHPSQSLHPLSSSPLAFVTILSPPPNIQQNQSVSTFLQEYCKSHCSRQFLLFGHIPLHCIYTNCCTYL
jgi:hypothetical protein